MIKVIEKSTRVCNKCKNQMHKTMRSQNENGIIWVIKCFNCESK